MSYNSITRTEVIGTFGVDSGTVMIIDPCYVLKDERVPDPQGTRFGETSEYLRTVDATCEAPWYGPVKLDEYHDAPGMGVVCSTLHGDGEYPVIAEFNSSGKIVRLIIDFDPEDEDDYDEDEDEDICDDCGCVIPRGWHDNYEHRDGTTHYVCRDCKDAHDDDMEDDDEEQ